MAVVARYNFCEIAYPISDFALQYATTATERVKTCRGFLLLFIGKKRSRLRAKACNQKILFRRLANQSDRNGNKANAQH